MTDSGKSVAIIGAGVMGLSAAYALRHHNVTVFDPSGLPDKNASAMAGGMLAPWSEVEHLPKEFFNAAQESIAIWKNIAADHDIGFLQNGSLLVAHDGDEYILERLATKLPGERHVNAKEIAAMEPAIAKRFETGIYLQEEAHLEPRKALAALMSHARHMVAPARAEELASKFEIVIDARGFAAEDNDKELRGVKGEIITVRNPDFSLERPLRLMHPRYSIYIVPRPDHIFTIGATLIESADENVTLKSAMELLSAVYSLHPSFAESEILEIRAGIRPAYPDNLPRMTFDGNIIRCNGLFRHGYLLAPVMADGIADMIEGRSNEFLSLFTRGNDEYFHQRAKENHPRRA